MGTPKRSMAVTARMREEIERLRTANAELLEALEMLVNLNRYKDSVEMGIVHAARAAIAKAKGE